MERFWSILSTSLTVSLVSKRCMRGVAEMKFSGLFVTLPVFFPLSLQGGGSVWIIF